MATPVTVTRNRLRCMLGREDLERLLTCQLESAQSSWDSIKLKTGSELNYWCLGLPRLSQHGREDPLADQEGTGHDPWGADGAFEDDGDCAWVFDDNCFRGD